MENEYQNGEAIFTYEENLNSKFVIHTFGPVWDGGSNGEENLIRSCYRNSLKLAEQHSCRSVAFHVISSGITGYPKRSDIEIARDEITAFLMHSEMIVFPVIQDEEMYLISDELYNNIKQHIKDNHTGLHNNSCFRALPSKTLQQRSHIDDVSIDEVLIHIDESFSEMVFRIIGERNLNEVEVYKKANMDRKLFSKIRLKKDYHPKKTTAVALAVSLNLDIQETEELLQKAGYALSHSSKFDIIIRFFLERSIYDITEINGALFSFDQPLLG